MKFSIFALSAFLFSSVASASPVASSVSLSVYGNTDFGSLIATYKGTGCFNIATSNNVKSQKIKSGVEVRYFAGANCAGNMFYDDDSGDDADISGDGDGFSAKSVYVGSGKIVVTSTKTTSTKTTSTTSTTSTATAVPGVPACYKDRYYVLTQGKPVKNVNPPIECVGTQKAGCVNLTRTTNIYAITLSDNTDIKFYSGANCKGDEIYEGDNSDSDVNPGSFLAAKSVNFQSS